MGDFNYEFFGLFSLENNDEEEVQDIDIEAFLKENYNDTIVLLTSSNYQQLKRPLLVIFHHLKLKGTQLWIDKLYEVAQKCPKTIQFAVADFEDVTLFHYDCNELDYFGFNSTSEPYVFAVDVDEHQHQFNESFSIYALVLYCEKLSGNTLYRSDPIPIEQEYGQNVEDIVADNFRHFVEENDKDVFVTLHSNYTAKYDEYSILGDLRRTLSDDSDILAFYKINTHTNYVPLEYNVSEYPTSFLIPRNNKANRLRYVHKFSDYLEIKQFIAKNTSSELTVLDRNGVNKRAKNDYHDNYHETGMDDDQKTVVNTLEKLTTIIEKQLSNEVQDENGFLKFLNSTLTKVKSGLERDSIKAELLTLASKRVREVLMARVNS